jgi:FkbM family methyltransferase
MNVASAKTAVRVVTGWPIRLASYLIPSATLLAMALALRRYHSKLSARGGPEIVLKMLDHFFCSLRPAIVEVPFEHFRLSIRLNDPLHYSILLGLHEPDVLACLHQQIKPGMTVFDVGANMGYFSLILAELVGKKGRVVCLEPDPRVVEVLQRNATSNGFENLTVVQSAASNSCGEVSFACAPASSWSGIYYERPTKRISVRAVTLDSLCRELGLSRVDFVKIDIEGAEMVALEGMSDMLGRQRPQVLVELHGNYARALGHQAAEFLRAWDYDVSQVTPTHILALSIGQP